MGIASGIVHQVPVSLKEERFGVKKLNSADADSATPRRPPGNLCIISDWMFSTGTFEILDIVVVQTEWQQEIYHNWAANPGQRRRR
jgi:hypothetical protein